MTISTNALPTYTAVGNREDLADMIYNVSPHETEFLSACAKVKATGTNHEWLTETLDTPADNNAAVEGDVIAAAAITPRVRLGNACQISTKTASVTTTQEAVDKAGLGSSEMNHQIANKMLSLKNDMDMSLHANNTKVVSADSTAPELAGVGAWLTSNVSRGSGGSSGGTGTAATNGTQRAFTESQLKAVLQSMYTTAGFSSGVTAYVAGFNKQVFSTFTGNSTRFKDADNTLFASISIYESDFGTVKIKPTRHVPARECQILMDDMWKVAELHPVRTKELPVSGLAEATLLYIQYTLECCNQASSGIVADLTTA